MVLICVFRLSAMPGIAGRYISMASGGRAEIAAINGSGSLSFRG